MCKLFGRHDVQISTICTYMMLYVDSTAGATIASHTVQRFAAAKVWDYAVVHTSLRQWKRLHNEVARIESGTCAEIDAIYSNIYCNMIIWCKLNQTIDSLIFELGPTYRESRGSDATGSRNRKFAEDFSRLTSASSDIISFPAETCWNPWDATWLWINTYRYIFSGMNIHQSQLWLGVHGTVPGFWPIPTWCNCQGPLLAHACPASACVDRRGGCPAEGSIGRKLHRLPSSKLT